MGRALCHEATEEMCRNTHDTASSGSAARTMPSMSHEPSPITGVPVRSARAISDRVRGLPPTATSASELRTIRPLRSSPSPVATAMSTQPLAARRSSPGSSASVTPRRDFAPRLGASLTPPKPPVTTTAPAPARPAPTSSASHCSCSEASAGPTTATYGVPATDPPASATYDDVDQLARHDDLLEHVLAVDVRLHVGLLAGQREQLVLGRARRGVDAIAHLAVDLDDQHERVGVQERLVGRRPRLLPHAPPGQALVG